MSIGLAAVFLLKLALVLAVAGPPRLQPVGDLDSGEYWRLAQRVVDGDVLLRGTAFYVSPLYIYWLAAASLAGGGRVMGVLVLQAVAGTAAVGLAGCTARSWVRGTTADDGAARKEWRAWLGAAGTLALTGIIALQEVTILQSAIDPLLMAAFAYAMTRALLAPSARQWLTCGLTGALLAANRPNAWLLACVSLAAAAAVRSCAVSRGAGWRACGAWLLGVAIVLGPLAARTRVAVGEWQALPGHGGLNFYIGNHAGATGTYTVVAGIRPSVDGQREDARRLAEAAAARALSDGEVSSWFVRRGLQWWRDAPLAAIRLTAWKAWLTIHAWELPVNVSYAWFREQVLLLRLLPVGTWLLIPLGLAVTIVGHRIVPAAREAGWRWFRWLLPAYLASVAVFFVVDRYRAPALVLAAVHVGVLAAGRRTDLGVGRSSVAAAMVGILVAASSLVPLPFHLGQGDADLGMALHAIGARQDDEATGWLSRAAARHATPGVAWLRAGLGWQARGAWPEAERALREAHRLDPEVGEVAFALAGVLLSQGRGAEAVPLLRQAEQQGVRPDRVRLDRALALWQAGDRDRARGVLALGVPREGLSLLRARALASADARHVDLAIWLLNAYGDYVATDAEVTETLGLMYAQRGDSAQAAASLEAAGRMDPTRVTVTFNLAILRARQGRREEAIALLRDALRRDPTYAQAAGALRELLGSP